MLNLQISKFHEGCTTKNNWNYQRLNITTCAGKLNFSVIHPTHITIYSFWRTMFSTKVLQIIGQSYILTVQNYDNRTFVILSVFTSVFTLKLETRLYCSSITLLLLILYLYRWVVLGHENEFCIKWQFMNFETQTIIFLIFKKSLAITPTPDRHDPLRSKINMWIIPKYVQPFNWHQALKGKDSVGLIGSLRLEVILPSLSHLKKGLYIVKRHSFLEFSVTLVMLLLPSAKKN